MALLVGLAGACGSEGDTDTPDGTEPPASTTVVLTSEGHLRIRPVVTLLPIDGMPLNPFGDDAPDTSIVAPNIDSSIAYDLGPAVADESDVTSAVAAAAPSGEWQITVTLARRALADVQTLVDTCLALAPECERGQIAVTIDGFVVTAIPVTGPIGPTLVLAGGLNEQQATVIADSLT